MKKFLLGTTALVAAGAFAVSAHADEMAEEEMMGGPISVSVGGYYHSAFTVAASDVENDRGHGLQQNIELEVGGSTTLDNGIDVSVRMRISGNDGPWFGGNNRDETEVNLSGAFGRINYGTIEGPAQLMSIWAPGNMVGGVKSPWFGAGISAWGTGAMNEDSLKLAYYSPAFNGISFGVSYSPEDTQASYGGAYNGNRVNDDPNAYGEGVQSAIAYSADVMGGSFGANVGYETYASEDGGEDATATRFGASISIDQISVGGAVQQRSARASADGPVGEQTLSDVGVSWSQGPLSLGLSYGSADNDGAANTVINGVGAKYNLGPGIDFAAQFNMVEAGDDDSSEVLLATFINF